jgi:hypothetical protein
VYLVKKSGGVDDGVHYAMKVIDKMQVITNDLCREVMEERNIIQDVMGVPFLMGLNYALQTDEKHHLILGEYIRNLCMVGSRA